MNKLHAWMALLATLLSSTSSILQELPTIPDENTNVTLSLITVSDTSVTQSPVTNVPGSNSSVAINIDLISLVYSIRYEFAEEYIPKLIANLITENEFHFNISSADLLNVLDLQHVSLAGMNAICETLEMDFGDINCEEFLNLFNVSIKDILLEFSNNVPNGAVTVPKILTIFGIDVNQYMPTLIFGNDSSIYALFANGNYTNYTIAAALNLTNSTMEDVFNLVRPIFLEGIGSKNISELLHIINYYKVSTKLDDIFDVLNKTATDFYSVPNFKSIITKFTSILNNESVWATAVGKSELVTIPSAFKNWDKFKKFVKIYIKQLGNNSSEYEMKYIHQEDSYVVVTINDTLPHFIEKAAEYEKNENNEQCTTLTTQNGSVVSIETKYEIMLPGHAIISKRGNDGFYNLGSPLVCQKQLYGVSTAQDEDSVSFLTFERLSLTTVDISTSAAIIPSAETSKSSYSKCTVNNHFIYLAFLLYCIVW